MINVKLIAHTNQDVTTLSSHAAKVCYTSVVPELGKLIDVNARLFTPGHHTTLEHNHFTFNLDGLSVSSVVFGIHLVSPYYNSDQRSGRFSPMYKDPDMPKIKEYLTHFYPNENIDKACSFVQKGITIYQENIKKLEEITRRVIIKDRELASDKFIEQNTPKFAQEQLRMFISQVAPTALDITLNTSAVAALWRTAWSPEMREITDKIRNEVLRAEPTISYMFDEKMRRTPEDVWTPEMRLTNPLVQVEPSCQVIQDNITGDLATFEIKDSVDTLPFAPETMDQNIMTIKTRVNISCATMGQDQRHRSIKRGSPVITGNFYLPPLLKEAGLQKVAEEYIKDYANLAKEGISAPLMTTIAPYGLMVSYEKEANVNALLHEQGKRLCWCAQEEISEVSRQLREEIRENHPQLAEKLAPPCFHGKCQEGVRFCGRQINKNLVANYFVKRRV